VCITGFNWCTSEGDVVTVEGEIMHEPKASALATQDPYYITRVH